MKLKVKIAIPGKVVWENEVDEVNIQTTTGKIGILPNHAPIIATVETSVLRMKNNESQNPILMVISDGYLSLEKNSIFIATDRCILEDNINASKLEQDYKVALERYNNAEKPGKKYIANKALKRINACYEILSYNNND